MVITIIGELCLDVFIYGNVKKLCPEAPVPVLTDIYEEKNFKTNKCTKNMYPPFHEYPSTALGHYYLQLPLYGKLLVKMLEGTKYENIKLLGCIVVLLKENSEYEEFRVPKPLTVEIQNFQMRKMNQR